jgi:hypothetical protein
MLRHTLAGGLRRLRPLRRALALSGRGSIAPQGIHLVWPGDPARGIGVRWQVGTARGAGWIELRAAGETSWQRHRARSLRSPSVRGRLYACEIGELEPDSAYEYRVGVERDGKASRRDVHRVRTAAADGVLPVSAAFFADSALFAHGVCHPAREEVRETLQPILERCGVDLHLSAHDQSYERTPPLRAGGGRARLRSPGRGPISRRGGRPLREGEPLRKALQSKRGLIALPLACVSAHRGAERRLPSPRAAARRPSADRGRDRGRARFFGTAGAGRSLLARAFSAALLRESDPASGGSVVEDVERPLP